MKFYIKKIFILLGILILFFGFFSFVLGYKRSFSISAGSSQIFYKYKGEIKFLKENKKNPYYSFLNSNDFLLLKELPKDNKDIINILILGMRGEKDLKYGGFLTDSIIIASFNKIKKTLKFLVIPRDLFVFIPGLNKKEKVNSVFYYGYKVGGIKEALGFSKEFFSKLTGVYIDYVVVFDFEGFIKIVDILGGVKIVLEKDFVEDKQWGCDEFGKNCEIFKLEKGEHILDAETALKFIRSRFSSSDFDRQKRIILVMKSIVKEAKELGFFDIGKILNIYNLLKNNIKTDLGISNLVYFYEQFKGAEVDKIIEDSGIFIILLDNKFLYSRMINGVYVLLPDYDKFNILRKSIIEFLSS